MVGVVGATPNTDGSWHLIAGVYDSSQLAVYLDGFVDGSTAASGMVEIVNAPLVFGQARDNNERRASIQSGLEGLTNWPTTAA